MLNGNPLNFYRLICLGAFSMDSLALLFFKHYDAINKPKKIMTESIKSGKSFIVYENSMRFWILCTFDFSRWIFAPNKSRWIEINRLKCGVFLRLCHLLFAFCVHRMSHNVIWGAVTGKHRNQGNKATLKNGWNTGEKERNHKHIQFMNPNGQWTTMTRVREWNKREKSKHWTNPNWQKVKPFYSLEEVFLFLLFG